MKIIVIVSALSLLTAQAFAGEQVYINYMNMYRKCISENGGASNGSVEACADNISEKVKKDFWANFQGSNINLIFKSKTQKPLRTQPKSQNFNNRK